MNRRLAAPLSAAFLLAFASAVRADDVKPDAPPAAAEQKGVVFEPGTPAFADMLAKSKADGKPVFIDFATETCGWCKKLDKEVYTLASVGDLMKAFVNVRVDAQKGEGPELAKRYGVDGFPTLVVIDATGEEVDRIVGYLAPEPFTKEVQRIISGDGTLATLRKAHAASPDDLAAGVAFAAKLVKTKPDEASAMLGTLEAQAKEKGDRSALASIALERTSAKLGAVRTKEAAAEMAADVEAFVKDFAGTPAVGHAASRLGQVMLFVESSRTLAFLDTVRAAATDAADKIAVERISVIVHKNEMAASLKRQAAAAGEDYAQLNEAAWTCFELKVNVKAALGWARTAVDKSKRDAAILDTLANLLWITNARAEALKIEQEAAEKADGAMKSEFVGNIAKWKAEMKASPKDEDGEEEEEDEADEDDEKNEKK